MKKKNQKQNLWNKKLFLGVYCCCWWSFGYYQGNLKKMDATALFIPNNCK
jgi:hypothetical protein